MLSDATLTLAEKVPAVVAGITQVYRDDVPLVTGPVLVVHEVVEPVSVQVGAPVGVSEPVTPVTVAVKVMT